MLGFLRGQPPTREGDELRIKFATPEKSIIPFGADALSPTPNKRHQNELALITEMLDDAIGQGQRLLRWVVYSLTCESSTGECRKLPYVPSHSAVWVGCPDSSVLNYFILQSFSTLIWLSNMMIRVMVSLRKPKDRLIVCSKRVTASTPAIFVVPDYLAAILHTQFVEKALDITLVVVDTVNENLSLGR